MKISRWFGFPSLLMGVLFLISVALQYNDPDPIQWMLIYGAAAVVSFWIPWNLKAKKLAVAVILVALPWLLFLLPDVIGVISFSDLFLKMDEKGGAVEVGRESGGLTIVIVWMLSCLLIRHRKD
jgi:hypothetical protein